MILFSHSGHQSIFGSNGVQHSTTAPTQNCWTKLSAYIGGRIVFQSTSREFLLLRSLLLLLPPSLPPSSNRAPTPPPSQQHDAVLWLDMGRPGTGPACLPALPTPLCLSDSVWTLEAVGKEGLPARALPALAPHSSSSVSAARTLPPTAGAQYLPRYPK